MLFSCEFCEISHNIFFGGLFRQLFHHKYSFCLLFHHDHSPFQKQCYTYFLAEYFFSLICRLEKTIGSIFQALSQKLIFNPVEHLRWIFIAKIVNSLKRQLSIFARKAPLSCSTRPLKSVVK